LHSFSSRRGRSSSSSDEDADADAEADSANPSDGVGVGAAERFGLASSSTGRYLKFTAEKEVIALLEKAAKADSNSNSNGSGSGSGAEGRGRGRGGGGGSRVVLHFSHPEFARCKIMDGHLEVRTWAGRGKLLDEMLTLPLPFSMSPIRPSVRPSVPLHPQRLASSHPHTLFIGISPLSAPFLVRKLRVKVLPHLVCFVEGAARDRLVGFEELGNTDGFKLEVLEERLGISGEWKGSRKREGRGERLSAG
jgi:hypothetical protein